VPLKNALEEALDAKNYSLIKMGVNGRKLIEEKYSMKSVAKQMSVLYDWVLNNGIKPSFVDVIKNNNKLYS
jgi:hypothetical protein